MARSASSHRARVAERRLVALRPELVRLVDVIHFVYVEVNAGELVLHAIDGTGAELDSVVVPRA